MDKLEVRGDLTIEAGYKGTNDAYCKITGTTLKSSVTAGGKKVGDAVNDAVKKVAIILRNEKQTVRDKKEQDRKTSAKRKVKMEESIEAAAEETFER